MNRPEPTLDPVRARRAQVARWTLLANRIGYLVLALGMALFIIGFALDFPSALVGMVLACLVISFIMLAPSIVLGYGIKAAEREDRRRGV